ncbi:MAG: HAMP domain-containing protein [Rubrivivax sp.]|nr:HAMP domain-containing protein [Rubrivivax sp.]
MPTALQHAHTLADALRLNRLRLGARLGLGFGALLLLMAVVVGIAGLRLHALGGDIERVSAYERRVTQAVELRALVELNVARTMAIAEARGEGRVGDTFRPLIDETAKRVDELQAEFAAGAETDEARTLLEQAGAARDKFRAASKEIFGRYAAGESENADLMIETLLEPAVAAYVQAIGSLAADQQALAEQRIGQAKSSIAATEWLLLLLSGGAIGVGVFAAWSLTRSVTRPLVAAVAATERVAAGDLTHPIEAQGKDEPAELMRALQRMQQSLRATVGQVRTSSDSIATASAEIAGGNQDLSARTEQTASNLQQAAASLEQLTGTVGSTAESARTANQLAASAADVAQRGGAVVSQVVSTMDEIHSASKKIADIIAVIDGIAFQTNILALNAAVEAARAGEQGRGFAVVAGEVRSLAQRSAEAAREIKGLIQASVEKVDAGSRLVANAGSTMNEIVASVQRVTDIIGEISAAASEQSSGIAQVNGAVTDLDRMTQQNAALVEQSAAAAESLKDQAQKLAEVVGRFDLGAGGGVSASAAVPAVTANAVAAHTPAQAARQVLAQVSTQAKGPAGPACQALEARAAPPPAPVSATASATPAANPAARSPPRTTTTGRLSDPAPSNPPPACR